MLARRTWMVVLLLALTVGWLGACQAPERVGEEDGFPSRPPNDDFAARVVLQGAGGTVVGSNVGATAEDGEPEHAGQPAHRSVWWTWTAPAAGAAAFDARGSDFDAVVGTYRGAVLAGLTPFAQRPHLEEPPCQTPPSASTTSPSPCATWSARSASTATCSGSRCWVSCS